MTRFTADLEEMLATVADMNAFDERLVTMLASLDEAVDELHQTWTGEAAVAHRDAHSRWTAGAAEMRQAGIRMRQAAERAHGNYDASASANEQMWRQTR